jgi:hypothetical protein
MAFPFAVLFGEFTSALAKCWHLFAWEPGMADLSSDMVRSLVLRELEDGVRHDGLWLQAMSESKLDQSKAKLRYVELRMASMQSDVKKMLIQQIRGAQAQAPTMSNADLASFLAGRNTTASKK